MNIPEEYFERINLCLECVDEKQHLFKLKVYVEFNCFNNSPSESVEIATDEYYSITACDYLNPDGPCTCIGYAPCGDKQVYVTEQMSDVENIFSIAREILKEPNKYYDFISHNDIENYMMK